MSCYLTWNREFKGGNTYAEIEDTFYKLREDLWGMGLVTDAGGFSGVCGAPTMEQAETSVLLYNCTPQAEAYVTATRWTDDCLGYIVLGVRHFFDEDKQFEEVGQLAEQYNLIPKEPFSGMM